MSWKGHVRFWGEKERVIFPTYPTVTDKNKNLITGSKLNIKIAGVDIANITSTDGKFNYEYTTTQNKGTYDILITAQETDNYHYNAKHMSLKVT